jgi:hypothetical protein
VSDIREDLGYRVLDAVTPRVYHDRIGSTYMELDGRRLLYCQTVTRRLFAQ